MAIYLATPKEILNSQFAIQVMARFKITVQLLQLTSKMETSCKFNLEKMAQTCQLLRREYKSHNRA